MPELPTMSEIEAAIASNPLASLGIAGATGAAIGAIGTSAISGISRKRSRSRRGRKRDRKFKSKQKHEQKYKRKRKYKVYKRKGYHKSDRKARRGSKKIYYARKTGQPYIILSSGKARFIKGKRRK